MTPREGTSATFSGRYPIERRAGEIERLDIQSAAFAFDTIEVDGWDEFIDGPERAHLLSKAVQHAWAAFAHTGDPTSPNLPTWRRFDAHSRATMILGPRSRLVHDPRGPIRETWMAGAAV